MYPRTIVTGIVSRFTIDSKSRVTLMEIKLSEKLARADLYPKEFTLAILLLKTCKPSENFSVQKHHFAAKVSF